MNSAGIWIAVAAMAVAASMQVVVCTDLEPACYHVDMAVRSAGKEYDGEAALRIAEEEIPKSGLPEPTQKLLFEAWDNIYNGKECSEKSWDYMAVLSSCARGRMGYLSVLEDSLRAYVKKCFKPIDLERRMKSAYDSSGVDFIDSDFLKVCLKDMPLAIRQLCRVQDSFEAVSDAVQRDLVKKGVDLKEFFAEPTDMSRYLKEKLVQPCENLKGSFKYLFKSTISVAFYLEDHLDGILASLSEEAREHILAFEYCDLAWGKYWWPELAFRTLREFVPQLDRNAKLNIERDFEELQV